MEKLEGFCGTWEKLGRNWKAWEEFGRFRVEKKWFGKSWTNPKKGKQKKKKKRKKNLKESRAIMKRPQESEQRKDTQSTLNRTFSISFLFLHISFFFLSFFPSLSP